jgi:glycosyltransferase involved in cell wall biosynthesis
MSDKVPITAFLMTLNEELYVRRCLSRLVDWADEVLVVDSASSDRTREIATAMGARVIVQPWLGYAPQLNMAMDAARHDWCLRLDADEVIDDELANAIAAAMQDAPDPRTGFAVERVEEFCSELMPNIRRRKKRDGFVRLMNRRHSRYDSTMLIHEEVVVEGSVRKLPGRMLHWRDFSLDERFKQDNRNATLEAKMLASQGRGWSFLRLAVKPVLRFLWTYVWCGCWRRGAHGLVFSLSAAGAEFMRQAKLWEMQAVHHQRHPPEELYRQLRHESEQAQVARG